MGTIEVVILRCKDGGGAELSTDPAETTVSRNPLPAERNPSSRAPSVRAPSVVKSHHSRHSEANSFGGILGMGLFDGAGDDPGYYRQYRPRNIVGQEHLPGHRWDQFSGKYRYFDDQDPFINPRDHDANPGPGGGSFPAERYRPQTYTVGGGFSYQESTQSPESRISGPKSFVPQTSPGYDFTTRRRKDMAKDSEEPPESTYDFTRTRKRVSEFARRTSARPQLKEEHRERQSGVRPQRQSSRDNRRADTPQQQDSEQHDRPGSGLTFVEDISHQMQELMKRFSSEVESYHGLNEDAKRYRDRKDIYHSILKASHRKHQEIKGLLETLGGLYKVVRDTLSCMDRPTWRQASDLLYERNLYPPPSFNIEPPFEKPAEDGSQASRSHSGAKQGSNAEGGWGGPFEQVGEGKVGTESKEQNNDDGWGNSGGNNDANSKAKSNNGWADSNESDKKSGAGSKNDQAWGEDNNDHNDGWGKPDDKPDNKSNDPWSNNKQESNRGDSKKGGTSDWGNGGAPKPKINGSGWEGAGGDKNETSQNADKKKQSSSRRLTSSRSQSHNVTPVSDGAASDSYPLGDQQPKPVIKPYWSEWTKKPAMAKPKVQPREVYEYPAPPVPVLRADKSDKGITYAVHAGRGANYAHKLHRPEYLDTMAKPYAIFTFKYRTKAALEKILRHRIDDSYVNEAEAEAKKHRLLSMPKDDLVEELMKKTSVSIRSKASSRSASNKVEDWGAADRKSAVPKRPTSHRRSPTKVEQNASWNAKGDVKPSDSVSQHPSEPQNNAGWGNQSKARSSRSKADSGWGAPSRIKASLGDHGWGSAKQGSQRAGGDGGWGNESNSNRNRWNDSKKPSRGGTATPEHFSSANLKNTW